MPRSGLHGIAATLVLVLAFVSGSLWAAEPGVVVRVETQDLSAPSAPPEVGTTLIQGRRLAMQHEAGGDGSGGMIFDGEQGKFWHIDHQTETYAEMTLESMKSMMSGIGEVMKQMEAQLENLPPEQRQMIQEAMREQMGTAAVGGGGAKTPVEVRRSDAVETIGGKRCRRYDVYRDGAKIREAWVAPWDSVGLSPESFKVFEELSKFFNELMSTLPLAQFETIDPFMSFHEVGGFPMVLRTFEDGEAKQETRLQLVERRELDASVFAPPKGYRAAELMH